MISFVRRLAVDNFQNANLLHLLHKVQFPKLIQSLQGLAQYIEMVYVTPYTLEAIEALMNYFSRESANKRLKEMAKWFKMHS